MVMVERLDMSDIDKHISFRITSNEDLPLKELFKEGEYVAVTREGRKDIDQHYHGYCINIKIETLRSRMKKHFSGNKQYKCASVKHAKHQLAYIFKGGVTTEPVVVYNTLQADAHLLYKSYWQDRRAYEGLVSEKKKMSGDLRTFVKEQCKWNNSYSTDYIVKLICRTCVERNLLIPSDYEIVRWVEFIQFSNENMKQAGHAVGRKVARIVSLLNKGMLMN